ncbi:MAG: hypothetical protein KKI02_07740, partial [Planctomycetes bacterium]|nr:hypothetical protein [Planctomycetota bacterium]
GTSLNLGDSPGDWLAFFYLPSPAHGLPAGLNSLGTLGGNSSVARDVNDSGQVVGGAQNSSSNMRPFLWLPTPAYGLPAGMNDLGTLGGDSPRIIHRAQAINSSGEVIGLSYTAAGDARAFIWLPSAAYGLSAGMSDLGTLPGGDTSWAFGINDYGRVVGTSNVTGGDFHAFIWADGTLYDLNDLIDPNDAWELEWVSDINNDGEITGWGTNPSSNTRAFLLTQPCGAKASMGSPPSDLVDEADQQAALELVTPAACGAGACGAGAVQCGLAGVGTLIGIRTRRRVRRRSEE